MIPQTLYNFNLFVDGNSYAGVASQLTLPKLKIKTEDYRAGGMDAPLKMDMGLEALEAAFSMTGVAPDVLKFFGLADQSAFNGTFRGAFKDQKGAVVAAIATFRGMLQEVDMGDWKAGDKAETKYNVACAYYKLEVDGKVVLEIDPAAGIRVVEGKDQLTEVRQALGV
ncbi:phage major tail tube protein [Pseudoduganella violacea]|uniref:Phage major tail tube protein n=1 Tax=Pseudoduganella violacea TaxID=1715466 RepID=A0A7W5B8Q9_9BURK|nr:phage major tail tube protein [Pseudoduganella violacea]MBB3118619.1 hypothetical protein [Pseudoduganella violacea]